jgi:type II secretory pathway component PulF
MSLGRVIIICVAILAIVYCIFLIGMSSDPWAIGVPLGIGGLIFGSILWAILAVRTRRRRAALVLDYLEQAVRLNLPLPRIVAAMREQEGGRFGRDLASVQDALERGAPIASVLAVLPEVPSRIVAVAAAAERVGRLPQVLGRVMDERRAIVITRLREGRVPMFRAYPLFVGLMILLVVTMYLVFVAPKYQQIFKDFKVQLPPVTVALLDFGHFGGPWIALIVAAVIVLYLGRMLLELWQGPGNGRIGVAGTTWVLDRLPVVGRMRLHRALGEMFAFAADALDGGRTLEASLAEAGQVVAGGRLRPKIDRWIAQLISGASTADAARAAGLPRLVSGMLAVPQRDETTIVETFRFLGRYYTGRFNKAATLLEGAAVPIFAMLTGLLVLWIALALFTPMISLVDTLTAHTGHSLLTK